MKARIGKKARLGRIKRMLNMRDEHLANIDNIHVRLQQGNNKTGRECYTVSLIPIVDCSNCKECKGYCYDINNVCWQPCVMNDRARNSAIHKIDPERYWSEISLQVKANYITQLRINVGGDLTYDDFKYINEMAKENPYTDFLFFTKSHQEINDYIDNYGMFVSNVKAIWSVFKGQTVKNKHNLPEAHILKEDGTTTAPEFGSYFCGGNCSRCHMYKEGCWVLKLGESVILKEH